MINVSLIGVFMHKQVTSNNTINSFLQWKHFRILAMYLLRLYNGEPLYETTGHIGPPDLCSFD